MKRRKKEEFFMEHIAARYADIYRYVFSRLQNESDAKDAAQNTMERAWKSLDRLRKPESVKSWLFQIAYNESINVIRKRWQTYSYDDPDSGYTLDKITEVHEDLMEILLRREERGLLMEAMALMRPHYREIIQLWAVGEFSQKEISEMLDLNYNTVRVTLFRGMEQLREIYRALEQGENPKKFR